MNPEISSAIILRIMRSVLHASYRDGRYGRPHEKCGILRGRGHRITAADRTNNVSSEPEIAFEIDPAQLLAAYKAQRKANALQIMGFYHTHLTDDPTPSVRDAEGAASDGMLWLIATSMRARLWRAVPNGSIHGRFEPVHFDLKVGKQLRPGLLDIQHVDYGKDYEIRIEGLPSGLS